MFWTLNTSVNFCQLFQNFQYTNLIFIFGQTPGSKWTVSNDFLARKGATFPFMKVCGLLRPQLKRASIPKLGHCALSNLPQACSAAQRHVLLSF